MKLSCIGLARCLDERLIIDGKADLNLIILISLFLLHGPGFGRIIV